MKFLFQRIDIPFANDDTHYFLPWLIGVMGALATLMLCLGLTINGWIMTHHANYTASFTVNIPAETENLPDKISKIHEALKRQPHVLTVSQLSENQLKTMLKPWLSGIDSLENLPLPAVFDVTLDSSDAASHMDYAALQKSLEAIAPNTQVDAHERWIAAFSDFSAAAQLLMFILALFILAAMGTMIAFTSRASLRLHARTVHLLHAIGAEDDYIAHQFQSETLRLVLPGMCLGCAVAGLIYWSMGFYMASLPVSLMPSLAMTPSHLALLLLIPPVCSFAACLVSGFSVRQQLSHIL